MKSLDAFVLVVGGINIALAFMDGSTHSVIGWGLAVFLYYHVINKEAETTQSAPKGSGK